MRWKKSPKAIGAKGSPWTAKSSLPGGDFAPTGYEAEVAKLKASYGFLSDRHARRLVRLYGTKAAVFLGEAASVEALGRRFGGDLYEREVAWLMEKEWARTSEECALAQERNRACIFPGRKPQPLTIT